MKLTQLESLRGAMAFWVFISHALPSAGIDRDNTNSIFKLLLSGGLAVDVFIVLSGFVIALTLTKQWNTGSYNYFNYIKARFFRIFPILLVTTIIAACLINISILALENLPWEISQNITRLEYLNESQNNITLHFFAHLSMMHGALDFLLPYSSYSINGPAWSISLEWQFYLLAPFIIGCMFNKNSISKTTTILIAAFILLTFSRYFYNYPAFLPIKIEFFIIGIASYFIYEKFRNQEILPQYYIIGIATIVLATKSIPLLIWSLIFWLILDNKSSQAKKLSSFVNMQPFQWFGKMSYSFYLIHMPVIYLSMYYINTYLPQSSSLGYLMYLIPISFSVSTLLSALLYQFVEKPFIKLGKTITLGIEK